LIARGEFSVVIMSLAGATSTELGLVVTADVLLLATAGPLLTRWAGTWLPARRPSA
jgi:CPA2 family monovalent cation:H+ antiporter-2